MTQTRFTEGPWEVSADGVTAGDPEGFQPFGGCGCCGSPWMCGDTKAEEQANAHLIAAAPLMYEALRLAVENWLPKDSIYAAEALYALRTARGETQESVA